MILSYLTFLFLFILSFFPVSSWSYGVVGNPQTFLPNLAVSDSEKTVSNIVFRRLVNVDYKTGEIQKDLLEDYRILENGKVYELTLKKNQYWQDGVPIMADDLLYTASVSGNLREVSSDKINDYTVRFNLPQNYSPFLSILNIAVLPSHLADKNSSSMPVGSSDYRITQVKTDRNEIKEVTLMTLNKNLPFSKITIKFYKDEENLILGAKQFEINGFLLNRKDNFENFTSQILPYYSRAYLLIFNSEKTYLTKDVRKKIAQSLNLKSLIEDQVYPAAIVPNGPFSGTWAQSSNYIKEQFAPSQIKLDKPLKIVAPNIRQARLVGENIKEQLLVNSGLQVSLSFIDDVANFKVKVREDDYDAILMAQEYGVDPDRYVFWHSSQNKKGLNYSNFSSIRLDKSLEEGREELTIEKRKSHYNIFQSVFSEEYPAIYLLHPAQYFYYTKNLKSPMLQNTFYPYEIFDYLSKWQLQQNPTVF